MAKNRTRFTKHYSNSHEEFAGRAPAIPFFKGSYSRPFVAGGVTSKKEQWERSLPCQCLSGLPILRRQKLPTGKWIAYCKKCWNSK